MNEMEWYKMDFFMFSAICMRERDLFAPVVTTT